MLRKGRASRLVIILALFVPMGLVAESTPATAQTLTPYEEKVTPDNPQGWWRMLDGGQLQVNRGVGGTANLGKIISAWSATFGEGLVGDTGDKASILTGANGQGWKTPASTGLMSGDMPADFTVEAWVNPSALPTCEGALFTRWINASGTQSDHSFYYVRMLSTGQIAFSTKRQGTPAGTFSCGAAGSREVASSTSVAAGTSTHIAVTHTVNGDPATSTTATNRVFVNGVLSAEKADAERPTVGRTKSLSFGAFTDGNGVNPTTVFNGRLDEPAFYNSALTAARLWQHANPAAEPDVPVPSYACGRTIRNIGGGQYVVDLEAFDRYPSNTGQLPGGDFTGYEDGPFNWRVSWSPYDIGANVDANNTGTPSKATVALPSLSTMPPGGWTATFSVIRAIHDQNQWGSFENVAGAGEFRSLDEDGPDAGEPKPVKPWWVPANVWSQWLALPDSWKDGVVITPSGFAYDQTKATDGHHWLPSQALHFTADEFGGGDFLTGPVSSGWKWVYATCTVTIDPLDPEDDTRSGTTGPAPAGTPTPTTTTTSTTVKPPGTDSTQGEDGTRNDCSAGFLGRVPVVGGLFDATARLICALKQLLVELFVPDDLGHYGTQLRDAWANSKATSPFAPVEAVAGVGSAFTAGYSQGTCDGPTITLPQSHFNGLQVKPLSACSGALAQMALIVRTGLSALIFIGGAFFLFRLFMVVSGLGVGVDG